MDSYELETMVVDAADNGVVTVTFNRPEKKNAANFQMWDDMSDTWNAISVDPDVRCVVITGAGEAFCSGADLSGERPEHRPIPQIGQPDLPQLLAMNSAHKTVQAFYSIMVPVIAKVNGVAAGAGMNIALACDLIVASDRARFSEIFARRGLSVDMGGTWILPRLVGLHRAKELALFGDVITAEQAHDMGLLNRVIPHDELDAFVADWADRLAAGPPLALSMTKRLLTLNATAQLPAALEAEGMAQTVNFASSDTREAIKAFLEKRPPVFTGG